jgi:hypothetical protein
VACCCAAAAAAARAELRAAPRRAFPPPLPQADWFAAPAARLAQPAGSLPVPPPSAGDAARLRPFLQPVGAWRLAQSRASGAAAAAASSASVCGAGAVLAAPRAVGAALAAACGGPAAPPPAPPPAPARAWGDAAGLDAAVAAAFKPHPAVAPLAAAVAAASPALPLAGAGGALPYDALAAPFVALFPFYDGGGGGANASAGWAPALAALSAAGWVDAGTAEVSAQLLALTPLAPGPAGPAAAAGGSWALVTAVFVPGAAGGQAPLARAAAWEAGAAGDAPAAGAGAFALVVRAVPVSLTLASVGAAGAALWYAALGYTAWLCVAGGRGAARAAARARRGGCGGGGGGGGGARATASATAAQAALRLALGAALAASALLLSDASAQLAAALAAANGGAWSEASLAGDTLALQHWVAAAAGRLDQYRTAAVAAAVLATGELLASTFARQPRLATTGRTLARAFADVTHFGAPMAALLVMYGVWGFIAFGQVLPAWASAPAAAWSLMELLMYDYDLPGMLAAAPESARWFWGSFMFLITNAALWALFSILFEAFSTARAEAAAFPGAYAEFVQSAELLPSLVAAAVDDLGGCGGSKAPAPPPAAAAAAAAISPPAPAASTIPTRTLLAALADTPADAAGRVTLADFAAATAAAAAAAASASARARGAVPLRALDAHLRGLLADADDAARRDAAGATRALVQAALRAASLRAADARPAPDDQQQQVPPNPPPGVLPPPP